MPLVNEQEATVVYAMLDKVISSFHFQHRQRRKLRAGKGSGGDFAKKTADILGFCLNYDHDVLRPFARDVALWFWNFKGYKHKEILGILESEHDIDIDDLSASNQPFGKGELIAMLNFLIFSYVEDCRDGEEAKNGTDFVRVWWNIRSNFGNGTPFSNNQFCRSFETPDAMRRFLERDFLDWNEDGKARLVIVDGQVNISSQSKACYSEAVLRFAA